MGLKVINTIIGLNIGAAVAYVIGMMTPMHSISFFGALGGVRVARMWTKLMSVNFETEGNEFCKGVEAIATKLNSPQRGAWCAGLTNTNDLQAVQQRMCSQLWTTVWPSFCDGLEWAYSLGMVLTCIFLLNFVVMGASMYLLSDYAHGSHKREKRRSSMIVLAIGLVVVVIFLFMYGLLAIGGLSDIDTANSMGWFNAVLAVSRGVGFSYGFVILWLGTVLQVISLCLWHQSRKNGEEDIYDRMMHDKFFREQARYGGLDDYFHGGGSPNSPQGGGQQAAGYGGGGMPGSMPGAFAQASPPPAGGMLGYDAQGYGQQQIQMQGIPGGDFGLGSGGYGYAPPPGVPMSTPQPAFSGYAGQGRFGAF